MLSVSLKLQHRINYMLEHLRTGDHALLVYMAHKYHRHIALFCKTQQRGSAFTHLAHTAGSAFHAL